MPWKPSEPNEVPTLGNDVIDWIADYLAAPDRAEYEPFILYPEQEYFVLRFYELNPRTGERRRRRGVISRSRGWGKSPFLAALAVCEALGPVVPDGWDAKGQPVGKPWTEVRTPLVQVAAVTETQTKNTWAPLLEMIRNGPVYDEFPGIEPLDTFVNLPRGRIEPITSSPRSVKGNRAVFAVLDQTEEWVASNGGLRLAETMRINAAKVGGSTVESPNAFIPGEGSVAEASAAFWDSIQSGAARDDGLFYDHREAPSDTDLTDRDSLIKGLRYAYGDSAKDVGGHVDLDVIAATVWDPAIDPQRARADFLNQITHASDSYISQPEWAGCRGGDPVARGDVVVLGFDGSRGRARNKPDATALIGCRVNDGHLFQVDVWEAGDLPESWPTWEPPLPEIEAAVDEAFRFYNVVGFFADPAKDWRSYVNGWEAKYGHRVTVHASREHPFEWWMTGGRSGLVQRAVENFEGAVRNRDLSHDGSHALTRHMLNARRRIRAGKLGLGKESDYSDKKIDAAVAAVLAWQARLAAVAAGVGLVEATFVPRRIR